MPRPYGRLTGRMAQRNKRSLESSEDCRVKMEFGQWGKKYPGWPLWGIAHKFEIFALKQEGKPQAVPNSWACPQSPVPSALTLHGPHCALNRWNTCPLAALLVACRNKTVTWGADTPWGISLHAALGEVWVRLAISWARGLVPAQGSWFHLNRTMLLKWTESVQREKNKDKSPFRTYVPKMACSLHPHLELLFK